MPRRILLGLVLAVLLLAPAGAQAALPSPAVVPGWPVTAPPGTVLRGPDRGVVVATGPTPIPTVVAFRRDGRRLWRVARAPQCGNCVGFVEPPRLQPNGEYGPIFGERPWGVDRWGNMSGGCDGIVYWNGTCTYVQSTFTATSAGLVGPNPVFVGPGYRIVDSSVQWSSDRGTRLVRDDAGRLYAGFSTADLSDPSGFGGAPSRVTALDPASFTIAWRVLGPNEALLGLESGVLARTATGLVALSGDGSTVWTRGVAEDRNVQAVGSDRRRGRILLNITGPPRGRVPSVALAVDAATGRTAWRTANRDRARFLSLGARGRSYVAIDRPGHLALRALDAAGRILWERRTPTTVTSARELADGTVAVSAGTSLTLLAPRRR